MPVQITITGDHATDVLSELQTLSSVLNSSPEPTVARVPDVEPEVTENPVAVEDSPTEAPLTAADVSKGVDADGLEWDERIHSGNEKMTAKGVWTRRRGVQDAQFDKIVAQIKAGKTEVAEVTEPVAKVIEPNEGVDGVLVINRESIKNVILKNGKDDKGVVNAEVYGQYGRIIQNYVPQGSQPSLQNIKDSDLEEVFYAISAV